MKQHLLMDSERSLSEDLNHALKLEAAAGPPERLWEEGAGADMEAQSPGARHCKTEQSIC
jgi:hypothetical protein